ncbi:MAG: hypothetical protein LIP09_13050 [Bacteroidales bacterium]|nr:hypothetical protein [Bacteroidales bacterium]
MKKYMMIAAVFAALGLNATYAMDALTAQDENVATEVVTVEFVAIEADQLPQAVKDAVASNFEGATINGAAVKDENDVKTYKVTIADGEGNVQDVLFNEQGEILPNA